MRDALAQVLDVSGGKREIGDKPQALLQAREDSEFACVGSGCRAQDSGLRVSGFGLRVCGIQGIGYRV